MGQSVEVGFIDQRYTDEQMEADATAQSIRLEVVKPPAAKHGFVLLPGRWVVERSFVWLTLSRRLAKNDRRLPETMAGLHLVAFATLMLGRMVKSLLGRSASHPLNVTKVDASQAAREIVNLGTAVRIHGGQERIPGI